MAQEYTVGINMGAGLAGQVANIRAQLYDTAHVAVGGLVSSGFTETGTKGTYQWHYAAFPDGFEGTVDFSISGTVWSTIGINNADFGVTSSTSAAAIAAAVWAYSTRTLTQVAASIVEALTGASAISRRRGDTWTIDLTGLGNISARTKLWFTIKESESDLDAGAILQIIEGTGLTYLNGAAGTAGQGSITVTDAVTGALTISVAAAATAQLELASRLYFDIQMLSAAGVNTLADGTFKVLRDSSRAVS